jgi:hypothetical protein
MGSSRFEPATIAWRKVARDINQGAHMNGPADYTRRYFVDVSTRVTFHLTVKATAAAAP